MTWAILFGAIWLWGWGATFSVAWTQITFTLRKSAWVCVSLALLASAAWPVYAVHWLVCPDE